MLFYAVLYIKMANWCKIGVENSVGLQGMKCGIEEQNSVARTVCIGVIWLSLFLLIYFCICSFTVFLISCRRIFVVKGGGSRKYKEI